MLYNYNKLKAKIVEKYGSQTKFAYAIAKTDAFISKKLNNKSKFEQDEIIEWCVALDIDLCDIYIYFFDRNVQKLTEE